MFHLSSAFRGFLFVCLVLGTLVNVSLPATSLAAPTSTCALTWELVATPQGVGLNEIAARATDDAWAVGGNGPTASWIQHWDGTGWTPVSTPDLGVGAVNQSLTSVSAISSSSAWAGGYYTTSDSQTHAFALHWNGSVWSVVPIPASGNTYVGSVAAASDTDVWVAGSQDGAIWLEHWDGVNWTQQSNTIAGTAFHQFFRVQATASHDIWISGDYYVGDNFLSRQKFAAFAHWDGLKWALVTELMLYEYSSEGEEQINSASAVASDGLWLTAIYVGATRNFSLWETRVMRWDGSSWQTMESEHIPNLLTMSDVNGASAADVWVLPDHLQPDLTPLLPIRHWDGSAYTLTSIPTHGGAPALRNVAAATADDVWILGNTYNYPNPGQNYLAHGHLPCAQTPAETTLLKPHKNVIVSTNKPTFNWASVAGAFYYELDLRRNRRDTPWQVYQTFDPTYTPSKNLKPKPDYYWRVRACNNVGCSPWTGFHKFQITNQ